MGNRRTKQAKQLCPSGMIVDKRGFGIIKYIHMDSPFLNWYQAVPVYQPEADFSRKIMFQTERK
jgi:hypothetical protein